MYTKAVSYQCEGELTMEVIAATHNKNKVREFREILGPMGYDVISAEEAGYFDEPEEDGASFVENSLIKARAIYAACHRAAIADDSGLVIDALGGEPGIYSARYGGLEKNEDRVNLVLKKMENIPDPRRTARFMCAIAFVSGDGTEITAEGSVEGRITRAPDGDNGFGYDPIFHSDELGKTFAQAGADEKNAVSHRGRALRKLCEKLQQSM